jgi:Xaa-Pro dipeptidase
MMRSDCSPPVGGPEAAASAPNGPEIDLVRLRGERLERLQSAMRAHGANVCLFFNQANVRYATGTAVMTVYSSGAFVRCALVPAEGRPILFEHPKLLYLARGIVDDVRPMTAWEFSDDPDADALAWAGEIIAASAELGAPANRLFVDKLGTAAYRALSGAGVACLDSGPITLDAREVKTPQEIGLFEVNAGIGMKMLASFEAAIDPGTREQELLAVLTDTLLREGGEYLISRACVSGPNTNPWNLEAADRVVESGDLVFVDTDAVGYEGYFIDVSRTFLCGDVEATPAQREAYRAAHEWMQGAIEQLRPGPTMREFAERAPVLPEKFRPQRYEVLAHQAGLEDEGPSIAYAEDPQPNGDRVLKENSVICLEAYVGEVGGRDGVKLEDQLLLTRDGARTLIPYPYCERLL